MLIFFLFANDEYNCVVTSFVRATVNCNHGTKFLFLTVFLISIYGLLPVVKETNLQFA